MHVISRTARLGAATALAVGGLTGVSAAPASAAPASAQSCFGDAVNYTSFAVAWPSSGWARTTTSCADINVRPDREVIVRTCFKVTGTCNAGRIASPNVWTVAASNVRDGAEYRLYFSEDNRGQVAH
ncbi:hypothetical protein Sfulv_61870 [Streptomyces fulvorobeus]|uniref:Secreted protein n=1 Tax=Streptomyces fulvorobeus TaxID=284028 RepID=A0A7J0CI18_9ACTN|nr:hypothetical protein Sfulv_61870 [Streptomyces fulvorobeus]